MKFKFSLFFLILALSVTSFSQAATLTVNSITDDEVKTFDGVCTLREAVININDGADTHNGCSTTGSYGTDDTIELISGSTYTLTRSGVDDTSDSGDLDIDANIIITTDDPTGSPATIDISSLSDERIFEIIDSGNSWTVLLQNLNLTGVNHSSAVSSISGGVINFESQGHLTLEQVTLLDNSISAAVTTVISGGLIDIDEDESSLTLDTVTIYNNNITPSLARNIVGGIINIGEGNSQENPNQFNLSSSEIYNNTIKIASVASSSHGIISGGIISADDYIAATISNSSFHDNTLTDNYNKIDGGIFDLGQQGSLVVTNSEIFSNNFSSLNARDDSEGGIFSIYESNFTLSQSSIYANSFAMTPAVSNLQFLGGVIYYENGGSDLYEVSIQNTTITENQITGTAPVTKGGAIALINKVDFKLAFNTIFNNNINTGFSEFGAGLYVDDPTDSSTYQLKSNIIISNSINSNSTDDDCYASYLNTITSIGYNFISNKDNCDFDQQSTDDTEATISNSIIDNSAGGSTYVVIIGESERDDFLVSDCLDIDGNTLTEDQRGYDRNPNATGLCYAGALESYLYYEDGDGDGLGNPNDTGTLVKADATEVANNDDCDDADPAPEASQATTYYYDGDGDGLGDPDNSQSSCTALGNNYVENADDCDDTDASAEASGPSTFYIDNDGDGLGSDDTTTSACEAPDGYVANDDDCNDNVSGTSVSQRTTYYFDGDGDRLGDPSNSATSCVSLGEDYVENADDCDDSDASAEASQQSTFYFDGDSDGYGIDSVTTLACDVPDNYVDNADDCNDDSSNINPGITEVCDDGVDNNCDGLTDDQDQNSCSETGGNDDDGSDDGDDDGSNDGSDDDSSGSDNVVDTPNDDDDSGSSSDDDEQVDDEADDETDESQTASSSGGGCQLQPQAQSSASVLFSLALLLPLAVLRKRQRI